MVTENVTIFKLCIIIIIIIIIMMAHKIILLFALAFDTVIFEDIIHSGRPNYTKLAFNCLKMPSKLIRILRITFYYKQLCGRCLVHTTPVVKVVIHCVFALL